MMALGTHIAWTAIALLIAADCWFLWELLTAPLGWQDERRGFVYGMPPADADEVGA